MTNHPETQEDKITLRCNKCGRPITPSEAIQTPTGYRCPDCVRQQQKTFDTAKPLDYVWGLVIALVLSLAASVIISFIRFIFIIIFLAPAAGVGIAELVRIVVKKRRSKRLFKLTIAAIILGAIPMILIAIMEIIQSISGGSFSINSLFTLGYQLLYLVLAVPAASFRLTGRKR
jgi:DNA-directed RNA polymerase subunit RPC12/RpoP